jgi:hypothetical protein
LETKEKEMKKIANWVLSVCALGSVVMTAAAPVASAQAWGSTVGPTGSTSWWHGQVTAVITNTGLHSWYGTLTGSTNNHVGGYFIQCKDRPLDGWPVGGVVTWTGEGWRNDYFCYSGVQSSYGWVFDN